MPDKKKIFFAAICNEDVSWNFMEDLYTFVNDTDFGSFYIHIYTTWRLNLIEMILTLTEFIYFMQDIY